MSVTPGQAPDLSMYYDSAWNTTLYYSEGPQDKVYNAVAKLPITANSTQPKENAIGFITPVRYITEGSSLSVENQSFLVQNWTLFLPEGTISFSPNSSYLESSLDPSGNFAFYSDATFIFSITTGTKNFLGAKGYVAIVTDPSPGTGRNVYIYFAK
jgi:hypothetical protein